MHKIVIHRPGGYDRLRYESHPPPQVGPGQLRLRVEGIGVNYADCVARMGLYRSAREYVGWPLTPGFEVCGVVDRVGEGVVDIAIGERCMAVTRFGGYASHVVVDRRHTFPVPQGWSSAHAAGFPTVHLTADFAVMELGRVRPGARVLVHSAAGGVGRAIVQIAAHCGCEVVGVVGKPHKVDAAREAGAHHVIDASRRSVWRDAERVAPIGYDVIFDANGVSTLRQSYRHLAAMGRLVIYGFASMLPREGRPVRRWRLLLHWLRTPRFNPLDLTARNRSVMGFNLSYLFDHHAQLRESMARIVGWAEQGILTPPPLTTYALRDAAAAHRALESGLTVGKLVLVPDASTGD